MANYEFETIYEPPENRELTWMRWKYNNTIISLRLNEELSAAELVLIDLSTKKITRIPISYKQLIDYPYPRIFGMDKSGDKRFWLIYSPRIDKYPILRVWEDGRTDIFGKTQKRPCYVNQMLITYTEEAIIISKDVEGKFETIREIPWKLGIAFFATSRRINNIPLKEIYGQKRNKIARLNLETLEAKEIGEFTGYLRYFHPDKYYFVEHVKPAVLRNIYQVKEGEMKLIKSFPDFDIRKKHYLRIFKAGIVIKEGKDIRVYVFPDLREIKFKKL